MNQKTMLDMGGLAFLEGDPLGLRELEERLVWNPSGPLPDWLDDADLDSDLIEFPFASSKLPPPPVPPMRLSRESDLAPTPVVMAPNPPASQPLAPAVIPAPIPAPALHVEPVAAEPVASEPVAAEPEPAASEPAASHPIVSEPVIFVPVDSELVDFEPVVFEPVASEAELVVPEPELAESAPETSALETSEPVAAEPGEAESVPAEPIAAESSAAESAPEVSNDPSAEPSSSASIGPSADNPDLIASKLAFTGGDMPEPEDSTPPPILPVMRPPAVIVNSPHEPGPPAPSLIDQTPLAAQLIEEDELAPFHDPDSEDALADTSRDDYSAEYSPENSATGLRSIDEILRFVAEPPQTVPTTVTVPTPAPSADSPPELPPPEEELTPAPPPLPARRVLGFDELIDFRLCLLAEIAGQAWAVPLDRVTTVGRRRAADAIDLYERFEGRPRRGEWAAITFDNDHTLLVDRILGPRSLAWEPLPAETDAPDWALAETILAGDSIRLLDWELVSSNP